MAVYIITKMWNDDKIIRLKTWDWKIQKSKLPGECHIGNEIFKYGENSLIK